MTSAATSGHRRTGVADLAGVVARYCSRPQLAGVLALQLLVAVSDGIGLTLLVPVFQIATRERVIVLPVVEVAISPPLVVGLVVAVVVVRAIAQWWAAVCAATLRVQITDGLRLDSLTAVVHADWRFIADQQRNHLVQSVTTEMQRAGAAIDVLSRVVVAILMMLGGATAAIVLAPVAGAGALGAVAVMGLATRRFVRQASRSGTDLSASIHRFGDAVTNTLASLRLIRAHDAGEAWLRVLRAEAAAGRSIQLSYVRRSAGVRLSLSVFGVLGLLVLLLAARNLEVGAATMVALSAATARMLMSAQQLLSTTQLAANLAPSVSAALRHGEEARRRAEVPEQNQTRPPGDSNRESPPSLQLRGVSVRYEAGGEPTVRDVDLDVPAGALTVITGPSGAGKSTLVSVVLGLLPPDQGQLLVDRVPVTDLRRWRARVGYVPQDVVIVPGTVWDNLVWSVVPGQLFGADDVWAALDEAGLGDVVRCLPAGLHTDLGDFTRLSGGERQRLGLARALLRRPDLLVLDEATSALDTATEKAVLERLVDGRRTVLLVTHRVELRRFAARSAVLSGRRLVDLSAPNPS
ncbi:MAG TPA: ABC transporter ATP-binding protein [Propionibacteriaceae bacterium]|nr:ABC transporter ATP-binding protein [Propionibacteriaceae bacterium]